MSENALSLKRRLHQSGLALLVLALVTACGNGEQVDTEEWVQDHGYGPVTQTVDVSDLSTSLASEGREIFSRSCVQCHAMDSRLMGPPLRQTVDRRTPEFIMNYILNPTENRENHPVGQELAQQYPAPMISMGLSRDDARAVLEYIRYYNEHGEDPSQ